MKFIAFDPGESTGYAVFKDDRLLEAGTADLRVIEKAFGAALGVTNPRDELVDGELVRRFRGVNLAIMEDWQLYPWMMENHALDFDKCRTARLIGSLEFICRTAGVPYILQPASIKDQAELAGAEDLFLSPLHENRHANDAIRHGIFYHRIGRHTNLGERWQPSRES